MNVVLAPISKKVDSHPCCEPPQTYFPISAFYKKRFGKKMRKVPITIATNCPNRLGLKGMTTCVFCDVHGSSPYPSQKSQTLQKQVQDLMQRFNPKFPGADYLAYFQAYTSSFTSVQTLRQSFETVLSYPRIKGIVVGTRPDCISKATLDLWAEFAEKGFLAVEIGAQSLVEKHVEFFRRGHSAQQTVEALWRIHQRSPQIDLGLHFIFGAPGETLEEIRDQAQLCNQLPITNVKLHHLHVLKNTPLEKMYLQGHFEPPTMEQYAEMVRVFLEHLSPQIAVHRLAALSTRWDELVAPLWTRNRMAPVEYIKNYMRLRGSFQGKALKRE